MSASVRALAEFAAALRRMGIRFFVGGSVASSMHGLIKKLEWYRKGNEVSSRQWNDVLGILKTQGRSLDHVYMTTWAQALGLSDLLARALTEANAPSGPRE